MGFLSTILGIEEPVMPPVLNSLVPPVAATAIRSGQLPQFNTKTIMLGKNEICRYIERAALVKQKKKTRYESRRSGGSFRVTKSYTHHTGRTQSVPIETIRTEYTEGIIYVTDTRIIFVAKENAFEKKIKNLTAVVPYTDAVGLQYGSQTINILVPEADLLARVLQMLY